MLWSIGLHREGSHREGFNLREPREEEMVHPAAIAHPDCPRLQAQGKHRVQRATSTELPPQLLIIVVLVRLEDLLEASRWDRLVIGLVDPKMAPRLIHLCPQAVSVITYLAADYPLPPTRPATGYRRLRVASTTCIEKQNGNERSKDSSWLCGRGVLGLWGHRRLKCRCTEM